MSDTRLGAKDVVLIIAVGTGLALIAAIWLQSLAAL